MLGMMPRFLGMSCFEIAHTPEANNLFTCIGRKGKEYLRSIPSHPICEEIVQAYTKEKQRYSDKRPRGRPIVRQASKDSLSTMSSSDSDLYSLDPIESGDEQQQVQRIPRRIAVAQKDIARIAIVRKAAAKKAAAKKAAAKKAKLRIIAKSTRLTCSGAVIQQRHSKQKR